MNPIQKTTYKLSLQSPVNFEDIVWENQLSISTILCPFIKVTETQATFSSDIVHYSSTRNAHFLSDASVGSINPKFILLTWELPRIVRKLLSLSLKFKYTVYIADEFNTEMRRYIKTAGKRALGEILEDRQKMLLITQKAVARGLKLLNIENDTVEVKLTSTFTGLENKITKLERFLIEPEKLKEFLGDSHPKYMELVKYWRNKVAYKGDEFRKMIVRDQIAYRAVMGEMLRGSNPVLFSGQPPEPGDFFHGILKHKILPTMFVYGNVEGVDMVLQTVGSDKNLLEHVQKFSDIFGSERAGYDKQA